MTFKEYLKTPKAQKKIKRLLKYRQKILPQCPVSKHMDTGNMNPTNVLPGANSGEQPSLS